jgi:UDP-N-acetylmuramoyl-tripeptide--D-alanyl-D-alanine ligase
MKLAMFIIYAVITLAAIVFFALREFHMLQLNGYKFVEHTRWMKKNFSSGISTL